MNRCAITLAVLCSAFAITPAMAGSCGTGKITEVREGGWSSNDLMIKIDYSVQGTAHSGTEFQGKFIRYQESLPEDRLKGIRTLASLAIASGYIVQTYTHTGSCDEATELALIAPTPSS